MATKIDGRLIASEIFTNLSQRIEQLKKRSITPTLAVLLVGDNPSSLAYITQKEKASRRIGAGFTLNHLSATIPSVELETLIKILTNNPSIHGLIVQLPLPDQFDEFQITNLIDSAKDVDGFKKDSPFTQPVAAAVIKILETVFNESQFPSVGKKNFHQWLQSQSITVLGRGKTAGRPVAQALEKMGCQISVIHSQTLDPQAILKQSDIIISCVGKPNVITHTHIKKGAIVIGVGLHAEGGKLKGDYDQEDIAKTASYFTPTPGGVGPVNVAGLWENVVKAAELKHD